MRTRPKSELHPSAGRFSIATLPLEHCMYLLACLIVGIVAGWLAERLMGRDHGLLTNLVVGVIGSLIGGFIVTTLLGLRYQEGLNLASIAVATVGAVVLLGLFGGVRRRTFTS
jgi:uncharacterized membrane protein YeaQ/YmgE (transglycosylase-associated protein family)